MQVANFEYVDEAEAAAEEAAQKRALENLNNSERTHFWEELLRDKYQEHKVEEFNALGKGKRNRKLVSNSNIYGILFSVNYTHYEMRVLHYTYLLFKIYTTSFRQIQAYST